MKVLCGLAALMVLLSGCANQASPQGEPADPGQPLLEPTCLLGPRSFNATAGGSALYATTELQGSSRYVTLDWGWDPIHLANARITAEWIPAMPTSDSLRMVAELVADRPLGDQPEIQGTSPLVIDFDPALGPVERPTIYLGPVHDDSMPAAAGVVHDQEVRLTIRETYRCSETIHP